MIKSTASLIYLPNDYTTVEGFSDQVPIQLHTFLFSLPSYSLVNPLLLFTSVPITPASVRVLQVVDIRSFRIDQYGSFLIQVVEADDSNEAKLSELDISIINQVSDSSGEVLWSTIL